MFTIYYFILIKDARSVGLRICSYLRIWWEYPWAKSRTKERIGPWVPLKNRLAYTCSERTEMPNFGMLKRHFPHRRQAELPRRGRWIWILIPNFLKFLSKNGSIIIIYIYLVMINPDSIFVYIHYIHITHIYI